MGPLERGGTVAVYLLVGCGPAVSTPPVGGTGGGGGSSTTAMAMSTTSTDVPGTETSTTEASSGGTSSGGSSSDTSSSSGIPEPPLPAACIEPAPGIVVERAEGPDGPLDLATAAIFTDVCTDGVALRVDNGSGSSVFRCFMPEAPLDGIVACGTEDPDLPTFTVETSRPFIDPDPGVATEGLFLRARVVGEGEGWDVAFEIDLPDCGEPTCSCPCD